MTNIYEDGRIVKGVNTTQDVDVDETPKQAKKFGNSVSIDGYPEYSFSDSVKLAGKTKLDEALEKIEEIYVGSFDLDDHEISYYNSKLKRGKNPKIINSGEYEIKMVKWPEGYWVIGIPDTAFIVVSKESDLKYLQWTRSYVNPEYRGKGILELLVKTAIDNNLKPLLTDYTLSIPAAKHFNKILNSPEFKVHIYDVDNDEILPYNSGTKIYHSPEGEVGGEHDGADYQDAEKFVWMIEGKDYVDFEIDDMLTEIKSLKNNISNEYEDIINKHFSKKLQSPLKEKFEQEYNISDYNKTFKEDAKILFKEELNAISEAVDKEIDMLFKKHFNSFGTNYWAKLTLTLDDNGKALEIEIFNNKSKTIIPFTGGTSIGVKFSFDYKEEIRDFLIELQFNLEGKYTLYLVGIPIEDLISNKKNLREGGGAFKQPEVNKKLRRIKREEIDKTLKYVADNFTAEYGMDYGYLKSHLMGSAGKQADSGDLDVVADSSKIDKDILKAISRKVKSAFGVNYSREDGLNAGHLNLALPIEGDESKGFIQIDLLIGQPEWMKFTHHSPGSEVSQYKGVFISQALGVIARMKNIWKHRDNKGERVGEINWAYDLEKGLHVRSRLRKKPGQGLSTVTPDEFESFPWHEYGVNPPRVPRFGYIDNPEAVVKILLGKDVKPEDIATFEELMEICKKKFGDKYPIFVDRLKDSLKRSSAQAGMPKVDIDNLKIFENNYIQRWEGFLKRIVEDLKSEGKEKLEILEEIPLSGWYSAKSSYDNILDESFSNKELQKWLTQFVQPYDLNTKGFLISITEGWNNLEVSTQSIILNEEAIKDLKKYHPNQIQNGFCELFFPDRKQVEGFKTQLKLLFNKDYKKITFRQI